MSIDDQGRRAGSSAREAGSGFRAPEFGELRRRRMVVRSVGITVAGFVAVLAVGLSTGLLTKSTGDTPAAVVPDETPTTTTQSTPATTAVDTTTPRTSRDGVPVGLAATMLLEEITVLPTEMIEGMVRITDRCVTVETDTTQYMAVWPDSFVSADAEAGELIFTDPSSGAVSTITDGDRLTVDAAVLDPVRSDGSTPVSRIRRYAIHPNPLCDDVDAVLVLGISEGDRAVFTLSYDLRGFYTEGSATEFDLLSSTTGGVTSGGKLGPDQSEQLLRIELEPGTYVIRNWQRPCPGSCGASLEPPVDECAARFTVEEPVQIDATVTVRPGEGCSFGFTGVVAEPTGVGDYAALTLTFPSVDGTLDCGEPGGLYIDAIPVSIGSSADEAITFYLGQYLDDLDGDIVRTGADTGSFVVEGREIVTVEAQPVGEGWGIHRTAICSDYRELFTSR